jgi:tRNA A-37 threonylcarbamoyl transferase component Bud32
MLSFDHWWNCRGEVVEPFNERRGGQSGVEKFNDPERGILYIKRQVGHLFRSLRYPLGKPTAIRERDAYQAFARAGLKTPELVFVEARKHHGNWQAILVTRELSGFVSLQDWYMAGGPARLGDETYRQFLQELGRTLGRLHRHGWCHGSLHFLHIYVTPGSPEKIPDIAFLDLERAQRKLTCQRAVKRDLRTLKRRAPVINGRPLLNDQDWKILLDAHQKSLVVTH